MQKKKRREEICVTNPIRSAEMNNEEDEEHYTESLELDETQVVEDDDDAYGSPRNATSTARISLFAAPSGPALPFLYRIGLFLTSRVGVFCLNH